MTPTEFRAEPARIGFRPTGVTTTLTEEWRHISGARRFITRPEMMPEEASSQYLETIRRGIVPIH